MSSTVHYPIPSQSLVKVKEGDEITSKTNLGDAGETISEETINLAQILQVAPSKIIKYLKIGIGENIQKGKLLAEKKSLFSTLAVKSPYNGKLKEVNLKTGILSIIAEDRERKSNFTFPFKGKIVQIGKKYIDIAVRGRVYSGIKADGKIFEGKIFLPKESKLKVLDQIDEAENTIVCCQEIDEDAIIKLDCIGVEGLIVQKAPKNSLLPWMMFEEKEFDQFFQAGGKTVCVIPEVLQAVVLD